MGIMGHTPMSKAAGCEAQENTAECHCLSAVCRASSRQKWESMCLGSGHHGQSSATPSTRTLLVCPILPWSKTNEAPHPCTQPSSVQVWNEVIDRGLLTLHHECGGKERPGIGIAQEESTLTKCRLGVGTEIINRCQVQRQWTLLPKLLTSANTIREGLNSAVYLPEDESLRQSNALFVLALGNSGQCLHLCGEVPYGPLKKLGSLC